MKKEIIKGFKGFDKNLKCRGFQYEVGKIYETDKPIGLCNWGFHFCRKIFDVHDFYSFSNEEYRFCEVEALGNVIDESNGQKTVTNKIKIVKEISREELIALANIGNDNIGYCNTGNRNTGNRNTGYCNTGNRNTGNRNTGYCNTGDWNTGYCNTGDWNTGNRNTGNRNTGYCNTGDWNTGYCNTGDWNTGDWNKTNRSAGVFCNIEPKLILFNKETDMTYEEWTNTKAYYILLKVEKNKWIYECDMSDEEKEKFPSYKACGGYLKEISRSEASKKWWNNLDNDDKKEIFDLPNFDLEVFNDIMELDIPKEEYERLK